MAVMLTGKTPLETRDEIVKWLRWQSAVQKTNAKFSQRKGAKLAAIYCADTLEQLASELQEMPHADAIGEGTP